jgi:hypothetical protein
VSDQRGFTRRSGRLTSTPITDFWQASRTVQDPSIPNLPLETAADVGSAAPFFNPPQVQVFASRQAGYIAPAVNLLATTLAVAVTLIARDPLIVRTPTKGIPQQFSHVNLLETTLSPVVAQAPFKNIDLSIPVLRTQPVQPVQNGVLPGSLLAPFIPDLGEQIGRIVASQHDQQANLLPLVIVAPQPFNQSDFPNPITAKRVQQPLMPDRHEGVTEPPAEGGAPFIPYDWPQFRRSLQGLAAHFTDTGSYTTEVLPFRVALPDSVRAAIRQQPVAQANLLPLGEQAPVAAPFVPWQAHGRIAVSVAQQPIEPQNLLRLLTATPPVIPTPQLDWPNPTIARKVQQPWHPERREGVTEPPVTDLPFRQLDWPNPQRLDFKPGTHAFDTGSYRGETPIIPVDWQRPVIARQVQQPAPINGVLQLLTYVAPPLPKNISDWPNPVLPILPVQDTAQYQNPDLITPYIPPIVTPDTGGGGWWPHYHHYRHRKEQDNRDREHRRIEAQRIEDEAEREIAKLLHEQEQREAERADLYRLRDLADRAQALRGTGELSAALERRLSLLAMETTRSALQAFERELLQQVEDDEIAALILILNDYESD